ncbi:cephalosporin esterase [Pholiota conissans]|uniref:Carboxylic ester hydrolase n=1 Tax=Pholiota conissans TaxID=109636 RepID=A0A9P5YTU5_9AGAR|nr:cephalosporin esterase [Pholiota conissans]
MHQSQKIFVCFLSRTFVAVLLPASLVIAGLSSPPTIDLGYSTYQGISVVDPITNKTNTNFLGLRYAAPPTADLRFSAPHPPASTSGVQIADAEPRRCWAGTMGMQPVSPRNDAMVAVAKRSNASSGLGARDSTEPPPFDEDCLFLNVYVPGALGSRKQNLPVVVWIHGGGYAIGSASGLFGTDIQNGNDLIREANNGVVVVVIQYRLGIFGFLPGQKVKDGGALNAGLLDQQFALQWVQKYINKFGGDPSKVTIWGQSAGAGSVIQHIIANGGETRPSLFRAAMTSSAFLPSQYKFNDPIPENLYSETVSQTNCSSSLDTLACLRAVDVNILQTANVNITFSAFFGTFGIAPVVDGVFIIDRPSQLFKRGKLNGDIILSFTNTFEGAIFVDPTVANTTDIGNYVAQLFPTFGSKEIQAAKQQYVGMGSNFTQAVAVMTESIFVCPTYSLQRAFKNRAFKGEFAIPPANHGDDVSYYFTSINPSGIPSYSNAQFDASFPESFLKFALSLDPNAKFDSQDITPHWNRWQGTNEMLFNHTEGGAPDIRPIHTSSALLKRCQFWDSVSQLAGQ